MKRTGILHPQLSAAIVRLGHTDTFVVADAGLPIPAGVERIDLAVTLGVPGFAEVLDAILAEVVVEASVIAREARGGEAGSILDERLPASELVDHEELKRLSAAARFVVRTGATIPYANVIIRCGVPF